MDDFGLGYTADWLDDESEDDRDATLREEIDELEGFSIVELEGEDDYYDLYDSPGFDEYNDHYDELDDDGRESTAEPEGV